MRTDEEQSEIKVKSYKWKSAYLFVTGHYEFEIILTFKISKEKGLNKKTFYRRFSDIEILHEGLIKYNPGSRIPQIPEKSIWCNICVNNDQLLDKRRKQIEEYLNYINNHKYLNKNPIFLIFFSEDFEKYKTDQLKKEGLIERINFTNLKSILPLIGKTHKPKGDDSDFHLEIEKENLKRLEKGISEAVKLIEEYINTNDEKSEALKNIFNSCRNLERVSTNYSINLNVNNENSLNNQNQIKNDNLQIIKENTKLKENFNKNIEIFYNLYDKNKTYCSLLENNVLINLKRYQIEIIGLREIFDRKDKIEEDFRKFKNRKELNYDNNNEISGFENIIENLYKQLYDELNFFQIHREKDLVQILKKFFLEKYEFDREILNIFENENKMFVFNKDEGFQKRKEEISDYIK